MNEPRTVVTSSRPILPQLSDARIMSIRREDANFIITEECDGYFEAELSREAVLKLIDELKDFLN